MIITFWCQRNPFHHRIALQNRAQQLKAAQQMGIHSSLNDGSGQVATLGMAIIMLNHPEFCRANTIAQITKKQPRTSG
jgi:hypothetical protein